MLTMDCLVKSSGRSIHALFCFEGKDQTDGTIGSFKNTHDQFSRSIGENPFFKTRREITLLSKFFIFDTIK